MGKLLTRPTALLFFILVFAFGVRFAGISYGLPLWLVNDEPPFVLGALKMIELRTILPALHLEEFQSFLYYPPYLSYLYLLPFSLLLGFEFLFFPSGISLFPAYLALDLSQFFLIARFLNILIGTLSVWLVYRVSKNIFQSEVVSLLSGFFLATSILHQGLSMTSRHWLGVSFLFLTVLFFLSHPRLSFKKRYFFSVLIAGLGMGVSPIMVLALIVVALWYLFCEKEKPSLGELLREKFIYLFILMFVLLSSLPMVLYPASLGFQSDIIIGTSKPLGELIMSPILFFRPIFFSEPVLMLAALLGFIFLLVKRLGLGLVFLGSFFAYSAAFYLFFRFESRFTLPLFPFLALSAGYGLGELFGNFKNRLLEGVLLLLLLIPFLASLRLGYLSLRGDSRELARGWIEQNLASGSRILVYSRLTRLASTREALGEQEQIDPASLRKVDRAEMNFTENPRGYKSFHALNLYAVDNDAFYERIREYSFQNRYEYLLLSQVDFQKQPQRFEKFKELTQNAERLASFGDVQENYSLERSEFRQNPLGLFRVRELGPPVAIYKLRTGDE